MHDEVFEATQDSASTGRDAATSAASSPSEAYANLTLESRETNGSMAQESDTAARPNGPSDPPPPRPPPRSSSPAKRPHSDMDDTGKEPMDAEGIDGNARRSSGEGSPRPTKPFPVAAQRSIRATSVEMQDASTNSGSATGSETASISNQDSSATSLSQFSPSRSSSVPSIDEQVGKVLVMLSKPPSESQEGYVISERWLERVWARTEENKAHPENFNKSALEGDIGPIDNSNLVDAAALAEDLSDQNGEDFVPLKPGLSIGQDFEILPQEAWELIISWYGLKEGTPVIRRYAHNTSLNEYQENLQYELYPPIFMIRRLRRPGTSSEVSHDTSRRSPKVVSSRSDGYQDFLRTAKKAAGIDMKTKVQVWRVLNTTATATAEQAPQPSGMLTPESSPRNGSPVISIPQSQIPPLFIDQSSFTNLTEGVEREMVTAKDETANEKYNGHMNLALAGLAEDQVLILEEQDDKGGYYSEKSRSVTSQNGVQPGSNKLGPKANKGLQSGTNSGRNSPTPSGPMTRGRTRSGRTRGTVGLTNLGNTCYMNSALQCIRSVEELSWYFLNGHYKQDINSDNPLGHGGAIAKSYAGLLGSIYDESAVSSFSPKNFKNTLGRAQPLFSGYGQQDSQEFLSFLVDGLHEDLNRVKKKPYTEYPESDDNTHKDPEAIKALGEKFRAIHHSRNASVAMDLFNGFYKNTMVCPECAKVSITFDPYSLLTLQLPIEQTWQHTIRFVPLHGCMVDVEVDIDKNATIKALKEYIAKRFPGVKWERLMGAEIYSHKFYRVLENNKSVAECNIGQRDDIYFFELEAKPTNWPPPKKPQKYRSMLWPNVSSEEDIPPSESPLADKMLVPIFHRGPSTSSYRANQWSMVLWPSYIVLNREEAKDYDTILKKVLVKVSQMTTRDIFADCRGNSASLNESRTGSDVVLTTEEDASPNGDPRVQDGSIEGEDMVEVTMTDPAETPADHNMEETQNGGLPEFLQPGGFIPPEFRSLFEIKHTRAGKEMVPTGWSSFDQNKHYDSISKRIRVAASRESSVQSLEGSTNASSGEETDENPQFSADAQSSIDIANQSSDEDEIQPTIEQSTFSRGGRQKNSKKNKRQRRKNAKTYGKGRKDRFPQQQPSTSFSEPESDDDESLLRLGEGIVLEWNADAYNALFEGTNIQDSRGMEMTKFVEILKDPELEAKKEKRASRKRHGITLEECFAETSKSEILSEDNAWYCNRCKELRRASKTLEIWTAPDILVIHLKRFSANRTFRDKIEALVDFPTEGLDLSGKVGLPEGKDLVYDLFAVDNHYGGLGGGHYTAYAQNFFDKNWYEYNDSSVSKRNNPQSIVTSSAYLLFYRRRSADPLGPTYLQEIVNHARNPDYDEAAEDEADASTSNNLSRSASGNGLRLGDSSRNGSSSAGAAGAGALRGPGSPSVGSRAQNGARAGTVEDEEMLMQSTEEQPGSDEGYGEGSEDAHYVGDTEQMFSLPYNGAFGHNSPQWGFPPAAPQQRQDVDDEYASDEPNMGSGADDELQERLMEDFGDEGVGIHPGMSTPLEDEVPELLVGEEDDPVAEVRLDDEVGAVHGKMD